MACGGEPASLLLPFPPMPTGPVGCSGDEHFLILHIPGLLPPELSSWLSRRSPWTNIL